MWCIGCCLNQWTLLIGALIMYFAYKWSVSTFKHWELIGIPFYKPTPFFGSSFKLTMARENMMDFVQRIYVKFNGEKIYGIFEMRRPVLMIRDLELIKQLTVKDFEYFMDHRQFLEDGVEPLINKNIFSMRGQRWRDMRATLSPVFTGSKMRDMFELITEVTDRAIQHLKNEAKQGGLVIDTKEMATRFTNDVIASTAFGLEINSFQNKDNEFYTMGRILASGRLSVVLKIFISSVFPGLSKMLGLTIFPRETVQQFEELVAETMKQREKSGIVRRDVIQLLMQAFKGSIIENINPDIFDNEGFSTAKESSIGQLTSNTKWGVQDLVAQCFIFFFAGFDSVANLMSFVIQELIENPDIQHRLFEEVKETKSMLNGKPLNYDVLQKMTYMDQVVSEALRKWPLGVVSDRVCTKPYQLNVDGKTINFKLNDMIAIPIYAIHRDPRYFENPEKFDPERFNDENKHNIHQFSYMPFGVGPRNCIASRFALMESKALIYNLLNDFKFNASDKTQIPIKMAKRGGFSILPENGFWAKLELR